MVFEVTDNACSRVYCLLQKENSNSGQDKKLIALRVSVDGGGCSGFMYNYELIHEISPEDLVIEKNLNSSNNNNYSPEIDETVKIIIDPLSLQFLNGCILDFKEELGASYFQITNPSATARCGCGNSFSV